LPLKVYSELNWLNAKYEPEGYQRGTFRLKSGKTGYRAAFALAISEIACSSA
jgi:hypothetical protein